MSQRPSIGSMLSKLGGNLQTNAIQALQGAVLTWLEANQDELLSAINQAQYERGAAVLDAFCQRFPWLAGPVVLAMRGTPAQAIDAIGAYDAALAAELRNHEAEFAELQKCWLKGREAGKV